LRGIERASAQRSKAKLDHSFAAAIAAHQDIPAGREERDGCYPIKKLGPVCFIWRRGQAARSHQSNPTCERATSFAC